jgi:hypothetical protein
MCDTVLFARGVTNSVTQGYKDILERVFSRIARQKKQHSSRAAAAATTTTTTTTTRTIADVSDQDAAVVYMDCVGARCLLDARHAGLQVVYTASSGKNRTPPRKKP